MVCPFVLFCHSEKREESEVLRFLITFGMTDYFVGGGFDARYFVQTVYVYRFHDFYDKMRLNNYK